MLVHRRLPLWTRPVPFFAGWILLVLGVGYGSNWIWTTTVFSGNLLVQTRIPTQLLVFEGMKAVWLVAAFLGLVVLVAFTFGTRRAAMAGGWWAPKMRFFPTVMLFGLFLTFFGAYWLFDLRVAFDNTSGGFVMFTSLNYANLLDRPFIGTVGLGLMTAGTVIFLAGSVDFRPPRPTPARKPAPDRTVGQTPSATAPPSATPKPSAPTTTASAVVAAAQPPQWLETGAPLPTARSPTGRPSPKRAARTRKRPTTRKPAAAAPAAKAAKSA